MIGLRNVNRRLAPGYTSIPGQLAAPQQRGHFSQVAYIAILRNVREVKADDLDSQKG